ncbi:SusC/RagA family TonB-linked outer membrane protein [Niastella vici]|uniref:SusC/RagA family TonB-linked outer membrane protein n=1 Tax=Niastella vici TaxID=1703345 RepID=A0A1V9FY40_9BACT|nr:TonB-dependent receptor [Niastella vici]OQP63252.1 SusC/RagA family TonB-linked outer membrane protein [Niastella vici]
MRKKVLCRVLMVFLWVLALTVPALAQTKTISGIISDQNGIPLEKATIKVKGGKASATSDANGSFKLAVPDGATTLEVSYVGMKPVTVSIEGKQSVLVTLNVTDSKLNEVVVIGYGTARRSDVSSAVSSIKAKDLKDLPVAGIDQALQGKVAGVSITNNSGQPGGGVSIRVRGITSVNGNEPLYVIDGVPILTNTTSTSQDQLGGKAGQTQQSVMATLNPADIASIDILKDASAQAIYGSLGANGVVLITTKRGRSGEGKFSYDVYHGWQNITKKLPVMNLRQYAEYYNSIVPEVRAAGGGLDTIGELKDPSVLGKGTDWQNEIYQTGKIDNHQLAFSGGQGKTVYYFSLNYFDQTGILLGSKFNRYAGRFSLDQQVKSWLKAGISTNLSRSNQRVTLADGVETPTAIVLYNSPATPVKGPNGQYITTTSLGSTTFGNSNSNPIATALLRNVKAIQSKAFGNIYTDVQFTKYLSLRNEVNYDFQLTENSAFQPYYVNEATNQVVLAPSRLREDRNTSFYWALRNYLTYNQSFGKHAINAVVGHEAQASHWDNKFVSVTNLTLNLQSSNAGTVDVSQTGGQKGDWSMESYFARATYTYDNRYSLSGSIRRDGSSSFGPNSRWGNFSAVSAGWTVTNEKFAQNWKIVDYLKFRVGAGSAGNQNSPVQNAYSTNIRLFSVAPFGAGGVPANVGNPNLSWEAVKTYNAGVDLSFIKKRIELSVDLYKKTTTNMILSTTLPVFVGLDPNPPNAAYKEIEPPVTNAGEMTNTGIDINLTTYNIQRSDFTWKTNIIFSRYRNELVKLNAPGALLRGAEQDFTGSASVVNITQAGRAVGTFYGYVTDGLFRNMSELNNGTNWGLAVGPQGIYLGDIRYKDLSGPDGKPDGKIGSEDVTFIGDPNPKFTYGITNSFTYKGFDFSFFLQGVQGSKIFNWTRKYTESLSSVYLNQSTKVMERYTSSNTGASIPRYNQWNNNNTRNSDRYIEDGSYLRIQNISIGYNFPAKWINKAKMSNARLYLSAQNIKTFTNYSGYDPEIGSFNKNVLSQNVDNGHYPNPRTITVGANIEF